MWEIHVEPRWKVSKSVRSTIYRGHRLGIIVPRASLPIVPIGDELLPDNQSVSFKHCGD
jgi:hypothetical protein